MKSWTQPTDNIIDNALSSVKKTADRQYFFSKLLNPLWLAPLQERGYFRYPPKSQILPDGSIQYPFWPELSYLTNIANEVPEKVVKLLLDLPKTDNTRVYESIILIATKLSGKFSGELLPKILENPQFYHPIVTHHYPKLIEHWTQQNNVDHALQLVKAVLVFKTPQKPEISHSINLKGGKQLINKLDPKPEVDFFIYHEILKTCLNSLSNLVPLKISIVLFEITSKTLNNLSLRRDLDNNNYNELSEIWCPKLGLQICSSQAPKTALVNTLVLSCEKTFINDSKSIPELEMVLSKSPWNIFTRIRQHLFSLFPSRTTQPSIRELILSHNYSQDEYSYEFQKMIKRAIENFGQELLSSEEQEYILNAIQIGPNKEALRDRLKDQFNENIFLKIQRHFHYKQLHPFTKILKNKTKNYYNELKSEHYSELLTDDSYLLCREIANGPLVYHSPKSFEELIVLSDTELLNFINEWDDEHHDPTNWLIEINFPALAEIFQKVFHDVIIIDNNRMTFWRKHRKEIKRPIFITSIIRSFQSRILERNFTHLSLYIEFCNWVLSQQSQIIDTNKQESVDKNHIDSDLRSAKLAVLDFIDSGLKENVNLPIEVREDLHTLLKVLFNHLNGNFPYLRTSYKDHYDQIHLAINSAPGRSIETLINFGIWIQRSNPSDPVTEVFDLLKGRLDSNSEFPLSAPESCLIGMNFGNLFALNREYALKMRGLVFPQNQINTWTDAFTCFLIGNRPAKWIFEFFHEDLKFALDHLSSEDVNLKFSADIINLLGQHFFYYYLWDLTPPNGNNNLLNRFYIKTDNQREHWGVLFEHVGRFLRNSKEILQTRTIERITSFFNWRYEVGEPTELQEFSFWLEAKCLPETWRLNAYFKILDLKGTRSLGHYHEIENLFSFLKNNLSLVIICFMKITERLNDDQHLYISYNVGSSILKEGLNSSNPEDVKNAERSRENLLKAARFEFLDLK
ncbi:hypothetical protein KC669_04365 [Candidatus Dojkabacteria bacterium]|uniref:Uncharacterized protein n=1 Tax=Candidatus Dojkabacteria bacterium TaxID=2099670 RepID=A0A955LBR7_9BACT|nr:hypothetical protein [Candidatus Dojkabacteria bacterium]